MPKNAIDNAFPSLAFTLYSKFRVAICLDATAHHVVSRGQDEGAYREAAVGGKCMASKAKLVLYIYAV